MKNSGPDHKGHRQRLRERFASGEPDSYSETAVLELLLTYAIPFHDVQPIARNLMAEFGSLSAVLEAPLERLAQFNGLKENSALLIKLVDWIHQNMNKKTIPRKIDQESLQTSLFDLAPMPEKPAPVPDTAEFPPAKAEVDLPQSARLFGKAVLKEAIQILPILPETESLDQIRAFLRSNLHFSAEQTRQRYASYITRRMFPQGYADLPLRTFARAFPNTQQLRDVCFYRFLKAEPLMVEIIEELLLPNIGYGRLSRERIRQRLAEKFPGAGSISDCAKAIVEALSAGGLVRADRTQISLGYRTSQSAALAFVLHSEFPGPGMYDLGKLEDNRLIRAMLWRPDQLLPAIYELRNLGWLSKVSEIDTVRQFTTRFTLAELVDHIIAGGKKE